LPYHRQSFNVMKSKKDLSPRTAGAGAPASKSELLPGEATAAKFHRLTPEEHETRRSKAYKYITMDDILNGRT
jgi:hypothetical protein